MAMVFEIIQTAGIAQLSYLVGDEDSQIAAVIDPRPAVEIYLELSRKYGVTITHIFETHIHADFMSGARELKQRLGSATIYAAVKGLQNMTFRFRRFTPGITLNSVRLSSQRVTHPVILRNMSPTNWQKRTVLKIRGAC